MKRVAVNKLLQGSLNAESDEFLEQAAKSQRSFRISNWRAMFYPNHRLTSTVGALNGNTIREQSERQPIQVRHVTE